MQQIKLHSRKYPGLIAFVDDDDYNLVALFKWGVQKAKRTHIGDVDTFYVVTRWMWDGSPCYLMLHRLVLQAGRDVIVDHVDRNPLNCSKGNLRKCDFSQNCANVSKKIGTTSKFLGVRFDKNSNGWRANCRSRGRAYFSKRFDSEIEAAIAYNNVAKEWHGEFANLNLIE